MGPQNQSIVVDRLLLSGRSTMGISIKYKLFFTILSSHIIVYAAMYSLGKEQFDRGFLDYINRIEGRQVPVLVESLAEYYEREQSWDNIRGKNYRNWSALIRNSIESTVEDNTTINTDSILSRPTPGRFSPNDWYYSSEYSPARPHLLLLDAEENLILGDPNALPLANLNPIVTRGQTVGYLAVTRQQVLSLQADILFSEQQKNSFFYFAIILVIISALIAFPWSSFLVRPIQAVVGGTQALTSGDYSSRIKVKGSDELSLLSRNFNILAKTLEKNRTARQQWIADISHELRTPLAILRGELEAVQDGVRPLNPETLTSLHHEVVHLTSLVNDLHELSLSDLGALVYEKQDMDIEASLQRCITSHKQLLEQNHIEVKILVSSLHNPSKILIHGDPKRLEQLFSNLIQNTCRYTDTNGELLIKISETAEDVSIEWSDTPPGVSDKDLEHLFDRLYRVDSSRTRTQGGSGLGLAISKNIVDAHEGTIQASQSELGGLKLTITLPTKSRSIS